MTTCPCCDHQMLRHIRGNNVYWFCRSCWQEMPDLSLDHYRMFANSGLLGVPIRKLKLTKCF